ncbi:MAG: methyltransferase domain-containing protein [Betaproteobacteria bacterium]
MITPSGSPTDRALAAKASAWVRRWSHLVAAQGRVLDLACGSGRHLAWFVQQGHAVLGIDRDAAALAGIALPADQCQTMLADVEGASWPLSGQRFAGVVVTNYLWRALLPTVVESVAEGGALIYETFAAGHETIGRPSRPDFLLQAGELLRACSALRVVAFEDGFEPATPDAPARFVQRIAAVRETAGEAPARHLLR